MCVDHSDNALSDSHCNNDTRPIDSEDCSVHLPICNDDDSNDNSNMII